MQVLMKNIHMSKLITNFTDISLNHMKNTKFFIASLLTLWAAFHGMNASAQVTYDDYLRADAVMSYSDYVYSSAVNPKWLGDSHYFWYENHEKDGNFFYLVNAETGKKYKAAEKSELTRYLPKKQKELADLLLNDKPAPAPKWHGAERFKEALRSPDGKWDAYIKNHNVYISPVNETKVEYALTMDGNEKLYYDRWALCWSPDSRKIATVKVNDVETRRIPLIESAPASQKQPILQWRDYAKPGDVLSSSLPVLFDVETRTQTALETAAYANQFSLRLTGWRADSRAFTFEYNQRGHQRYVVGEVDAETGAITHLADEQTNTFIYYNHVYRHDLNDGEQMLWISERDGWRHIYLHDNKGQIKRQITKGEWVVRNVDYIDEENEVIYFTASGFVPGEDPYNIHYCRIGFDGNGFEDMTPENGNHIITLSKDRNYFVDVYSRPDFPAVSQLRRTSDGSIVTTLETCDVTDLVERGWTMPEVFCAKGRDGKTDIWGNIHRPPHFDPTKSYPVVEMIYAGPHDNHVVKDFKPANHLVTKLTELGFIVVSIDGMGTCNRSKAFHDVCWKNLKDAGFPDRIAWMKAAGEKYDYMDLERVGIYGWSAGGQNAMAALLFHNDFYKVAVALCGCHDNRMDKVWWNEQWMGFPLDESYSASSNVDNAHLLKGKLLLINGELDDNVDPTSTLQVVDALMKANKKFDQLYLPGRTHSLGAPFEIHKMYDFFVMHLLGQPAPEWE